MKQILLVSAVYFAFAGAALAADAVVTEPTSDLAPAGFVWAGGYVGLHVGYGRGNGNAVDLDDSFFDESIGQTHDVDTEGFVGGVQAGHNWQTGSFVYGLEADIGYLGLDGVNEILDEPDNYGSAKLGLYGDLTARLGFAADRLLIYVKGGVAATRYDVTFGDINDINGTLDGNSSESRSGGRVGYTIGGGVELALSEKWTTKLEYQYFDFGTVGLTDIQGDKAEVDIDAHTIKVGLNYRF
ncbi:outer membrane immunogenic protein [Aminobacter niigataensis]|uniref:Outer membrane immunogenic protein n=1 Tax=Aminobacter niigataensis TaxID=83265 RepID=A0ABR6KZ84_9HYPH|nr:outer membrane protein [Aminobacter niigataensis]MBB4649723.1 outer membrane immunogenic protein [Aminobacter niigataensis]